MWPQQYDIIVETLMGSQFEVTVTEKDTVGYIKSRIQKYEGIPVDQQHLIYNQKELLDKQEIKDIPLVKGSTVKLVLDMKGGPVSARRVVTLPGYDKWFELSDVLSHSGSETLPVKLLVYKDCKKNVHRVMKLRPDKIKNLVNKNPEPPNEFHHDDELHDDQWLKDNIQTLEKMRQLKTKLDKKKKQNKQSKENYDETYKLEDEDDDVDDLLKEDERFNLNMLLNDKDIMHNFNDIALNQIRKKSIDNNEFDDVWLNSILDEPVKYQAQNKTFNLSPRRPNKNLEKSNFSRFFHHRNSSPTLSSPNSLSNHSTLSHFDYTNSACNLESTKNKLISQSCNYISENRTKLRDNIRRNRSFKLIDNDLIIEEGETPNRTLSASSFNNTTHEKTIKRDKYISRPNSASAQNLIEHFNTNNGTNNEMSNSILNSNKRWNTSKFLASRYIEKEQAFQIKESEGHRSCSEDFKINNSQLDNSFRVFKMAPDAKNCYELPKLLIREDSPVESYHSSDSQIETIALRGNSPKNVVDTLTKLDENDNKLNDTESDKKSTNLLKLYDTNSQNQRESSLLNLYETPDEGGGSTTTTNALNNNNNNSNNLNNGNDCHSNSNKSNNLDMKIRKTWNYHISDLGLNKLELNFLNDNSTSDNHVLSSDTSCLRKSNSVLKIASSNMDNKWKNLTQLNINNNNNTNNVNNNNNNNINSMNNTNISNKSSETSSSFNFVNGDVSSSEDEDNDDVFNSCEQLHNNKSKSVELNEFRMIFGSSPTLLNTNNYNFNSISQTSRLDAVPFQYRRGYSNLNDACLSSSTSDLECFQNNNKKKIFNKNKNAIILPSLYRHQNNEHLDYIRSYENLDRSRIIKMRNERVPSIRTNSNNHLSNDRSRLPEENDIYDYSAYQNLLYEKDKSSIGCIGTGSTINRNNKNSNDDCSNDGSVSSAIGNSGGTSGIGSGNISSLGYPSDESIFNINFDNFEDDVLEIDTMRLFENSIDLDTPNISETTTSTIGTKISHNLMNNNSTTLLLPDINNKFQNLAVDNNNLNSVSNGTMSLLSSNDEGIDNKKSKKLRCAQCNKKLGVIMIMKCHCEKIFCVQHRYAEAHNCTYNFKTEGKKILAKENPQIVAQKLPKI